MESFEKANTLDTITVGQRHVDTRYQMSPDQFLVLFTEAYIESLEDDGDQARALLEDSIGEMGQSVVFHENLDTVYERDRVLSDLVQQIVVPGINSAQAAIQFADDLQARDANHSMFERVVPIYRSERTGFGDAVPFANVIYFRLDKADANEVQSIVTEAAGNTSFGGEILEALEPAVALSHIRPYWRVEFASERVSRPLQAGFEFYEALRQADSRIDSIDFDWMLVEPYLQAYDTITKPLGKPYWHLEEINAQPAWDQIAGTAPVQVAIIDSGFELGHEDIKFAVNLRFNATQFKAVGDLNANYNYYAGPSKNPHGTGVTGVAAAVQTNNLGAAGVAGSFPTIPIRVGPFPTAGRIADSMGWIRVRTKAKAVNLSLGVVGIDPLHEAIDAVVAENIIVVAASGNWRKTAEDKEGIEYPAYRKDVIAVGAVNEDLKRKGDGSGAGWKSRYGSRLDVVAPGVNIITTDEYGTDGYSSGSYFFDGAGTSAAAPQVAGLAAMVCALRPDLTAPEVCQVIFKTCRKVHNQANGGIYSYLPRPDTQIAWNKKTGYGLINCQDALLLADSMPASSGTTRTRTPASNEKPKGSTAMPDAADKVRNDLEGTGSPCAPGAKSLTGVHLQHINRVENEKDPCSLWRLYLNVDFSKWVEFDADQCIASTRWNEAQTPLGLVTVWVYPDTRLIVGQAQSVSSFLRGRILARRSAQPQAEQADQTQSLMDAFLDPAADDAYSSFGGPCG